MTREEAIAFLDAGSPQTATATNAPPAQWQGPPQPQPRPSGPPQESVTQYWGRSPVVERAPEYVRAGAELVGQGAMAVNDAMNAPMRAAIRAPMEAGRYVAESPVGQAVGRGASYVGREAARNIGAGWNAVTAPVRYAGREINRTIVEPAADLARTGMDYVNRGVEAVEGAAGRGAGQAMNWFNRNVRPPPIATPQTRADYDALPRGSYYVDPETGKTYRKK